VLASLSQCLECHPSWPDQGAIPTGDYLEKGRGEVHRYDRQGESKKINTFRLAWNPNRILISISIVSVTWCDIQLGSQAKDY
jgi:hypothetical protein